MDITGTVTVTVTGLGTVTVNLWMIHMAQASKRNKKQPTATPSAEEIVQGFLTHVVRLTTINLVCTNLKTRQNSPVGIPYSGM